jgi:hypothetical protein
VADMNMERRRLQTIAHRAALTAARKTYGHPFAPASCIRERRNSLTRNS